MNVTHALEQSCDVFFYNVGMHLGIDRLSYYGSKLGVGRKTGIDLPSEEPGLMPSAEWVERVQHRKWYQGEVISVATGQGAVTTTPVQLARMIGGIAAQGLPDLGELEAALLVLGPDDEAEQVAPAEPPWRIKNTVGGVHGSVSSAWMSCSGVFSFDQLLIAAARLSNCASGFA